MVGVLSCASVFAQTPDQHLVSEKPAQGEAAPARFDITLKKISKAYEGKDLLVSIVKKLNNKLGEDWLTSYRHAPQLTDAQIEKFTKALEDYLTPEERDFVAVNLSGYRRAYDCPFVVKLEDRVACRENPEARGEILKRYKNLAFEAQASKRPLFDLILKQPRSPRLWHSQGKDVFARRLADAIRGMALTVETRRDRPGFTQRELGFERALTAYRQWTSGVESEVVNHFLPKSDLEEKAKAEVKPTVEAKPVAKPTPVVKAQPTVKPVVAPVKTPAPVKAPTPAALKVEAKPEPAHAETKPEPKKVETPQPAPAAPKKLEELVAVAGKLEVPAVVAAPVVKPVAKQPAKVAVTPAAKPVVVKPTPKPAVVAKPTALHVVETVPVTAPALTKPTVVKPVVAPTVVKKAPVTHAPARKKVIAKKTPAVKKPASTLPKELATPVEPANSVTVLSPPLATEEISVVDNDVEKAKAAHTTDVAPEEKPGFFKTVTKPVTNLMGGVKETFFHKRPADPKGVVAPQLWTKGEMTGLPIIHDLQEGKEYARYIIMKLRKMARDDLANRDATYREQVASYNERVKAFHATKHPSGQKAPIAPKKPVGSVSWYEAVRDGATFEERNAFLAGLERLTPAEKSFIVPLLTSIGEVGHITNGRCKGKGCVEDMTGISNGVSVLRTIYNSAKSPLWGSGKDFIDAEHHDKSLPDRMFHAATKNERFSPWNRNGRKTQGNIPGMLKSLEKALMASDDAISTDLSAQKAERMINAYVQFSTDNVNYDGFDLQKNGVVYPIVFFSAPGYHLSGTAVPSSRYVTYKDDASRTKYYTSAHRFGYDKSTGYKIALKGEDTQ